VVADHDIATHGFVVETFRRWAHVTESSMVRLVGPDPEPHDDSSLELSQAVHHSAQLSAAGCIRDLRHFAH